MKHIDYMRQMFEKNTCGHCKGQVQPGFGMMPNSNVMLMFVECEDCGYYLEHDFIMKEDHFNESFVNKRH
jgi:C4-type Zn-finger protein